MIDKLRDRRRSQFLEHLLVEERLGPLHQQDFIVDRQAGLMRFQPPDIGIDDRADPLADRSLAGKGTNEHLVVEVVGELERLMLVACLGAAIHVPAPIGHLHAAKPCGLSEIRALVEVDCAFTEGLADRDRCLGIIARCRPPGIRLRILVGQFQQNPNPLSPERNGDL